MNKTEGGRGEFKRQGKLNQDLNKRGEFTNKLSKINTVYLQRQTSAFQVPILEPKFYLQSSCPLRWIESAKVDF